MPGDKLNPEERARVEIDRRLELAGWILQNSSEADPIAAVGVAIREFTLPAPYGRADYMLFVNGVPVGVIEAKPIGALLTGVEWQSARYANGIPEQLKPPFRPLPFVYESTGVNTRFTNTLDPAPRSRAVFWFPKPGTMEEWLRLAQEIPEEPTLRHRLQVMPPLGKTDLWPPKEEAIQRLEVSLAANKPRALIQMATGSGKTLLAAYQSYRLIRHADVRRILFLVDRANLGRQARTEFQQFVTPDDGRRFVELYNVQRLGSDQIDPASRVCISTIQRLYSVLRGEELPPEDDERSPWDFDSPASDRLDVDYNPEVPPETFDVIIVDECHRSIYGLWRQVIEYFDAYVIGLTATPNKLAFGFFNQNLIIEYPHHRAVADGVNVDFDIYRIRTKITEEGGAIEAGQGVVFRSRRTREERWEYAEDDIEYGPRELDRGVVAPAQIRAVVGTLRDRLFKEIFPGRKHVPKTLIFAKDDSHADDIVQIVREEFDEGNEFCRKITYSVKDTDDLISALRNDYYPRVAVTVDMIATGTDIKPLECLVFMRGVKSRLLFEQMRGRGVRVISASDLQAVTPDALVKDRFVLVDAVGITEAELIDNPPLERKPQVGFEELVQSVVSGERHENALSSLAARLIRLDARVSQTDREILQAHANGRSLSEIAGSILEAIDPDAALEAARESFGPSPTKEQVEKVRGELIEDALTLLANQTFTEKLLEIRVSYDQLIDVEATEEVLEAGFSLDAADRAKLVTSSFKEFIDDNKDEIVALQILYGDAPGQRLTFSQVKELAAAIERPPRNWTPDGLWAAYAALDKSSVRGSGHRTLTDLVSLVRFTLEADSELVPYQEQVAARFENWLAQQEQQGKVFTDQQGLWLEMIRDHIAGALEVQADDLELPPFVRHGGLGKATEVFGDELSQILSDLNEGLVA